MGVILQIKIIINAISIYLLILVSTTISISVCVVSQSPLNGCHMWSRNL